MAVRLLLALLVALGLVLPLRDAGASPTMAGASAAAAAAEAAAIERTTPTIESAPVLAATEMRAAERAELTTRAERVLVGDAPADPADATPRGGVRHHVRAARWCDVVQCRRLAGAHLLRHATAPPALG